MSLRHFRTCHARRRELERRTGVTLPALGTYPLLFEDASRTHCENMIGAVSVPVGVAGPLLVNRAHAKKNYFVPLATSEGALVASVNRGCKAVTVSGGVVVRSEHVGITRGPVFVTTGIRESRLFEIFLADHLREMQDVACSSSSHLALLQIVPQSLGRHVFARFVFSTDDAMGMNMATFATQSIVDYIHQHSPARCLSLAGNFDSDKKPSWLNAILGRGRRVWAEVLCPRDVVRTVLKTTPERLHDVCVWKCQFGSQLSGSMGYNAHFANCVAAIFLATGQDMAHVSEGSIGIVSTELIDRHLYLSVFLPDLIVGVVGGGTGLPAQKDALSLLGTVGGTHGEHAEEFAEIVGATVLAGELSLLASLAAGTLVSSHRALARP